MKLKRLLTLLAFVISLQRIQAQSAQENVNQANVAMDAGNFAEAKRLLDISVRQEPDFAEAWVARGMASSSMKDKKAAKDSYEQALTLLTERALKSPNSANEPLQQVTVLILLSRVPEAKALLRAALKKFPNDYQLKLNSEILEDWIKGLSKYDVTHE